MGIMISINYQLAIHKAQLLWNAAEDYGDMIALLKQISLGGLEGSVPIHLEAKLNAIVKEMETTKMVMTRCGNNIQRAADAIRIADEKAAALNSGDGT